VRCPCACTDPHRGPAPLTTSNLRSAHGSRPLHQRDDGGALAPIEFGLAETVPLMPKNQIGEFEICVFERAIPSPANDVHLFPGMAKGWGEGSYQRRSPRQPAAVPAPS
jgi:hypothetical protein